MRSRKIGTPSIIFLPIPNPNLFPHPDYPIRNIKLFHHSYIFPYEEKRRIVKNARVCVCGRINSPLVIIATTRNRKKRLEADDGRDLKTYYAYLFRGFLITDIAKRYQFKKNNAAKTPYRIATYGQPYPTHMEV